MYTYINQSTEYSNPTSLVGKPAASSTMISVTNPAEGIAAAPTDAAEELRLQHKKDHQFRLLYGVIILQNITSYKVRYG